jgi:N,N'-diacetylchitobiose transport system substrate-binding protein
VKKRFLAPAAIALAVAAGVSGGTSVASADTTHTLNIWLMTGEISPSVYNLVNAAFESENPGWTVNVQIQQWSGISTKLITALASSNPPDAMEIGNTDVAEFAASGGLENLAQYKSALPNNNNWLGGLEGPAEYNGGLYAVPLLAGDRVVVYNKQMFAKAGITQAPNSISQLLADGAKLKATFGNVANFSPLYLPGEYWYAGIPLLWANGGQIATQQGGKWTGDLTSKGSLAGLAEWQKIQNTLSVPASRDVNTNAPDQDSVLASGKAAMIVAGSWEPGVVIADNKSLTGQLGTFVFPGPTANTPAPVFIGGSDIGIAANSPNQQQALEWVKLMTGKVNQISMVKFDGLMPNATSLLQVGSTLPLAGTSGTAVDYYKAANHSDFTPATPGWATVEADNVMETLFSQVASGKQSIAQIAAATDKNLDNLLNARQ